MGTIIIANREFPVDAPVVNFRQPPFYDASQERCLPTKTEHAPPCPGGLTPYGEKALNRSAHRYSVRPALRRYQKNPPLDAVKAVLKQFVLHHDGCSSADMCFNVLQNERGLSCHFLLDNDGTIYQTLDLAFCGFHAAEFNPASIGIEFCNRGDAKKEPSFYAHRGMKRDVLPVKINNSTILAFDFTPEQYYAFEKLARALTKLLPNIPIEYPQTSPGEQAWETLDNPFSYSGYIGHYHLTRRKWDPGPFDFKAFCKKLRGQFCFPMFTKDDPAREPDDRPLVPQHSDELTEMAKSMYNANEIKADGGFFPVGPWGETRLWHGGIHVVAAEKAKVFAPFPGRIVLARTGGTSDVGSTNFVLVRHDLTLGAAHVQFYSLYMHLLDEHKAAAGLDLADDKAGRAAGVPDWMTKTGWLASAKAGEVALLDEPIEAGAVLGRVGKAGPAELARAQLHLEVFSSAPLFGELEGSPWEVIDGTAGGRFCDVDVINDAIDTNHDGALDRGEMIQFYQSGGVETLRYAVTLNVSEWTAEPSWKEALRVPLEFRKIPPAELDAMVDAQIMPGLWWDEKAARHAKLPIDGVVYHYHPVTFLRWFNEKLLDSAGAAPAPRLDAASAGGVPEGVSDDGGEHGGSAAFVETDVTEDPCNDSLTLEKLVQGFDAPECTP